MWTFSVGWKMWSLCCDSYCVFVGVEDTKFGDTTLEDNAHEGTTLGDAALGDVALVVTAL